MAATSTTETWDAAWTLTMRAKRKRLTDNISDQYPTVGRFRKAGIMEVETGGKEIQEDLMYALTSSEWFDGYDQLNTDATDGITAAFYNFRYQATPIVISMTEEMESRKEGGAVKLLTAKTTQAMTGAMDNVNAALHSAQSGKSILGLQDIVPQSAGTTLGGINATNETWWENQRTDFDATYTSFLTKIGDRHSGVIALGTVWNNAAEGNDKPNLILSSYTTYGYYEQLFEGTGHTRFVVKQGSKNQDFGLGADGDLTFRGAPWVPDRDCASDDIYLLNTKYLKLKVQAGMNFSKTPFKEPTDQMAKVAFVIFGAQLVTNHRARQGVLYDVTS